jgi:lipopolysaccharide export system protein LptC
MNGMGWPPRAIGVEARSPRGVLTLRPITEWLSNLPGNRHSRHVAMMRLALPVAGIFLLLLVAIWPRVAPLFDRLRFAAIDLREARELRMMNPRYAGTDRSGRPFIITAAIGRQVPERDDVMALDQPRADLKSHNGSNVVVTADSGVYQSNTQFLDLFGHVTVTHENGTQIVTASARLDAANNAGEGHDPVEGHGPSGDIKAQGFQIIDKGDIIIFTGNSDLSLRGSTSGVGVAAPPASLPPPIAQAATQIEAAVAPLPSPSPPPAHAAARPAPRPAPSHAAKAPVPAKPAPKKPS